MTGSIPPTWDQFKEAFVVFHNDYQIVGHPGEPTVSPFDEPREYGKYSLTQIPDLMTEKEFESQMVSMKKILITCMDKRVARKIWESENGASGEVFLLAIGGGVVQNRERLKAVEVIAGYLAQFHWLREVVASDHEHVCGAVRYFLANAGLSHEDGLPGLLGKPPGSEEEREIMNRLIAHGAQPWIQEFGDDKVVAKDAYVNESERDVQEFLIQITDLKPLSIEQLEHEMQAELIGTAAALRS
jgi:carbonic anhydrase